MTWENLHSVKERMSESIKEVNLCHLVSFCQHARPCGCLAEFFLFYNSTQGAAGKAAVSTDKTKDFITVPFSPGTPKADKEKLANIVILG